MLGLELVRFSKKKAPGRYQISIMGYEKKTPNL